jgi:hypothetical protein
MSDVDPPRLLDDPSVSASARAALAATPPPPPLDPLTSARVFARVTAPAASAGILGGTLALKTSLALAALVALSLTAWRVRRPSAPASVLAPPARSVVTVALPESIVQHPNTAPGAIAMDSARDAGSLRAAPRRGSGPSDVRATLVPARTSSVDHPATAPRANSPERVLLEQAQRALERDGDPARALSLLDEHRRRFARSPLEEERAYLTLRARHRAGDLEGARGLAAEFVRRHPMSLYAPAARRIAGASR